MAIEHSSALDPICRHGRLEPEIDARIDHSPAGCFDLITQLVGERPITSCARGRAAVSRVEDRLRNVRTVSYVDLPREMDL